MIEALKAWEGRVEVNGQPFDNIAVVPLDMLVSNDMCINLYPIKEKCNTNSGNAVIQSDSDIEYKITVKQYMTKKSEPGFDFMAKWNNDVPMPLRTMQGTIVKETRGMVYMKLHGVGLEEVCCMRCGRRLTHPVSRHYGIGPECMQKVGIIADIEDVESIKEQMVKIEWEGWVIKSAILEQEEVEV